MINVLVCFTALSLLQLISTLNSRDLYLAFNAATVRANSKGIIHKLEKKYPSIIMNSVYTCHPDPSKNPFPTEAAATGSLREVLKTNRVIVGGIKFNTSDGDYFADPPVGYLPEYLSSIVDELNFFYRLGSEKQIKIERIYGKDIQEDIDNDIVYFSDIYYYIAANHKNQSISNYFRHSCVTFGYQSKYTTKVKSQQDENLDTFTKLRNFVKENLVVHKIVAISTADYQNGISRFPPNREYVGIIVATYEEVIDKVLSGEAIAGFTSGVPSDPLKRINVFDSGMVSPRAALFKRIELELSVV